MYHGASSGLTPEGHLVVKTLLVLAVLLACDHKQDASDALRNSEGFATRHNKGNSPPKPILLSDTTASPPRCWFCRSSSPVIARKRVSPSRKKVHDKTSWHQLTPEGQLVVNHHGLATALLVLPVLLACDREKESQPESRKFHDKTSWHQLTPEGHLVVNHHGLATTLLVLAVLLA
jgi:hypothetical protein